MTVLGVDKRKLRSREYQATQGHIASHTASGPHSQLPCCGASGQNTAGLGVAVVRGCR